jgi:hypothetical protein
MNASIRFRPALLAMLTVAAMGSSAAWAQSAGVMTEAELQATKTRISEQFRLDKAACERLSGNAEDICEQEADGKQKVARAELEARYSGKPDDQMRASEAQTQMNYEVSMERCDDLAGNGKDVCQQRAKAAKVKAEADAKAAQRMGEARTDAADEKRDANYKLEVEKCDALAGDAKATCISAAKSRFSQD